MTLHPVSGTVLSPGDKNDEFVNIQSLLSRNSQSNGKETQNIKL